MLRPAIVLPLLAFCFCPGWAQQPGSSPPPSPEPLFYWQSNFYSRDAWVAQWNALAVVNVLLLGIAMTLLTSSACPAPAEKAAPPANLAVKLQGTKSRFGEGGSAGLYLQGEAKQVEQPQQRQDAPVDKALAFSRCYMRTVYQLVVDFDAFLKECNMTKLREVVALFSEDKVMAFLRMFTVTNMYQVCLVGLIVCCVGGILSSTVYVGVINSKSQPLGNGDGAQLTSMTKQPPDQCKLFQLHGPSAKSMPVYTAQPVGACVEHNTVDNFIRRLCDSDSRLSLLQIPTNFTWAAFAFFWATVTLYIAARYPCWLLGFVALGWVVLFIICFKFIYPIATGKLEEQHAPCEW